MFHDAVHDELSKSKSAVPVEHEHIADISIGGVVGDDARETNLLLGLVHAETKRIPDRALNRLLRNSLRPIAFSQKAVNDVEVQARAISAHYKPVLAPLSHTPGARGLERHSTPRMRFAKTRPTASRPCICKESRRCCSGRTAARLPCGRVCSARIPLRLG